MKRLIYFLTAIIFFTGCNNNGGNLSVTMTYKLAGNQKSSSVKSAVKSYSSTQKEYYTQFGNYITSITPSVYITKFLEMRFQNYDASGVTWNNQIRLIDSNMSWTDQARFANFTNNNTINLTPLDLNDYNSSESTEFNIFVFCTMFTYQEFELPAQYETVANLKNLVYDHPDIDYNTKVGIGGVREGLTIKGCEKPFVKDKLFDNGMPNSYVFGETNSTYVWKNTEGGQSINDPLGQGGYIVRSNKYNAITINEIPEDQTLIVEATMSFDTNNLIQIYAGVDNIPYTSDDIFVYAPKYWERLNVSLGAN